MPAALSSSAIINLIQTAFANVELGDGITLHQAIALDNYCTDEEVVAARSQDTENHWMEIPRATLINFESALSFFPKIPKIKDGNFPVSLIFKLFFKQIFNYFLQAGQNSDHTMSCEYL
jgi:hypothetical protein